MADIRIKDLATTATTSASDDYLALDGSTNGTRKILATNVANNVTDVVFGASGPSAKSSIAARAARQGLVFDGTAGTSIANSAVFGSGNFSVSAWVNVATLPASIAGIFGGAVNSFSILVDSAGLFVGSQTGVADLTKSTSGITAGKWALVTYTKSSTTGTYYINGVSAGTPTDSKNYSVATTLVGSTVDTANYKLTGTIAQPIIYNRALSAAEVVSLYEAGVPAGADYPSQVAGTAVIASADQTFNSSPGGWTLGTNATIASNTLTLAATGALARYIGAIKKNAKYLVQITIGTETGTTQIWNNGDVLLTSYTTTGAKSLEFTASQDGALWLLQDNASATITLAKLTPLGLLLAPDAAQSGGGLTWYDTSGNAANITLPATGVTWNVPTSGYLTSSSSLNLRAGGTNQNITLTPSGTGQTLVTGLGVTGAVGAQATGQWIEFATVGTAYSLIRSYNRTSSAAMNLVLNDAGGKVLLGTTIDSGALLQVGTNTTTSAGGMVFGTDTFLHRLTAGQLSLDYGAANAQYLRFSQSGVVQASIGHQNGVAYLDTAVAGGSIQLRTGVTTTALTLSSTQAATFAGAVTANNSVTSSSNSAAPTVKIYDARAAAGGNGGLLQLQAFATSQFTLAEIGASLTNGGAGSEAGDLIFKTASSGTLATRLTIAAAGAATFAGAVSVTGALKLGNAYVAGAVVGTGYVTIQDSTGTTYRVPVLV